MREFVEQNGIKIFHLLECFNLRHNPALAATKSNGCDMGLESMSNRNFELLKIVADKIIFGLVLIGFGYWLNRRFELFKADISLQSEINKKRVECWSKVWGDIHNHAASVLESVEYYHLTESKQSEFSEKEFLELVKESEENKAKANDSIMNNRFWYSYEQSEQIDRIREFLIGMLDRYKEEKSVAKIREELAKMIPTVDDVAEELRRARKMKSECN